MTIAPQEKDKDTGSPPGEIPASSTRKCVAGTIAGTILLVVAINFGLLWYLRHTPHNLGYWVVNHKWQTLAERQEPADWLILGDSSGLCSVDTNAIESELGGKALNLCTHADCTVLNGVWMLQAYIDKHGPPRGVILVHVYDVWQRSMLLSVMTPMPAWSMDYVDPRPRCAAGWREQARLFLYRDVPLDSQNRTLGRILQFRQTNASRDDTPRSYTSGGTIFMLRANPGYLEEDFAEHRAFLSQTHEFVVSADNRAALRRYAELSKRHDFPIFLFNSPLYEKLWNYPEFQAYFSLIPEDLAEIVADSPRFHCLVDHPMVFSGDMLQSVDHIIEPAAGPFTDRIARRIQETLTHESPAVVRRSIPETAQP